MTYIFEIYISYCIRCILAFFDSIISFYVMGLFVYSTYVFSAHRRLPLKISFTNSIKVIKIFHKPFYCDSKTFTSRFWLTMCFTGWLHLSSNISVFSVQPLIFLTFFNIFYVFIFRMSYE